MYTHKELRAAATRYRKKEAGAKERDEAGARRAEAGKAPAAQTERAKKAEAEKRKRRSVPTTVQGERVDPPTKRPRSQSPPARPVNEPEAGVTPIDLTAETPPEGQGEEVQPTPPTVPEPEVAEIGVGLGPSVAPPSAEPAVEAPAVEPAARAQGPSPTKRRRCLPTREREWKPRRPPSGLS